MTVRKKISGIVCLAMCLLMLFPFLAPVSAGAENEIDKLMVKTSASPVALMVVQGLTASTSTTGTYISAYNWYDTGGEVIEGTFGTGDAQIIIELSAQEGYVFSENLSVYLNNEAVEFTVDDTRTKVRLTKVYTPMLWQPTIIKNPKGEKVIEGERAGFTASANYANEYKWTLKGPNGESLSADKITGQFPTCSVRGDGTGNFVLHGIPLEMDGWKVVCTFTGPGGSVTSKGATINVEPKPTPTPDPTPTPTSTPQPTPTPSPSASPEDAKKEDDKTQNEEEEHVHQFSDKWYTNSRYHWHKCSCGQVSDKEEHVFKWETVKKANKKGPGLEKGVCEVCGYETTKEIEYKPTVKDHAGLKIIKIIIVVVIIVIIACIAVFGIQVAKANRYKSKHSRKK